MITVVGLGINEGDITEKGKKAIKGAGVLVVKTALSKAAKWLKKAYPNAIYLDEIYENAEDFSELDSKICSRILSLHMEGNNVVYCVDGSGTEDSSVFLLSSCQQVEIICGVSAATAATAVCGPRTYGALTTMAAVDFLSLKGMCPDSSLTFVVTEIDDRITAGEVKLQLARLYGDETDIFFRTGVGGAERIPICELDRQSKYDYSTCAIVPPNFDFTSKQRYSFSDLMRIIYRLRDPDGCKWDRAQTHQSILSNCIEEAYELVEAVNNNDIDEMTEESGDVLLQGLFHCVIGEDEGEFDYIDVLSALCIKLVSRHTHIFGDVKANNAEEALLAWEKAKAKEKHFDNFSQQIEHIAKTLPTSMRAKKVQKVAKKAGYDWNSAEEAAQKVTEELQELLSATDTERESEGGDLLFAVINVLRLYGIEPDLALHGATEKFIKRFEKVEALVTAEGKVMTDLTAEQLDVLWNKVKADEGK